MITFNILIGIKMLNLNSHLNQNDPDAIRRFVKRKRITISLCAISVSFLIMTLPSTVFWAFFVNQNSDNTAFNIGGLLDFISFLNHASIFYTSYLTNKLFKKYVNDNLFFCRKNILSNIESRARATNNY
jgi:hypothetical protein